MTAFDKFRDVYVRVWDAQKRTLNWYCILENSVREQWLFDVE